MSPKPPTMTNHTDGTPDRPLRFLQRPDLQALFDALHQRGYQIIGPTIDQEAIVYDELESPDDLPHGWTDEQAPASYRLRRRDDDACFGYSVGPHSWKRFLFPPQATVCIADHNENGWEFSSPTEPPPKYALLGVRACELAAMKIQDRVFIGPHFADPIYQSRREQALVIAVQCTQAAATCFCTSMNSGPECRSGFDLALTELADGFLIEAGSDTGLAILDELPVVDAVADQRERGADARQQAVAQIQRHMNTDNLREILLSNLEHAQWDDVADRCLSCTNCTMVCPTCFCASVEEVTDLAGDHVERRRHWDSCFNPSFSYIAGGNNIRDNIRSRYRQWLTHKLASWVDQFGTSGCVGCGRCISWCPAAIDLTAEVAAIREGSPASGDLS